MRTPMHLAVAALAGLASGCGLSAVANVVHVPGDAVRALTYDTPAVLDPPEVAGAVERALHEAARKRGQPGLLADTRDPRDDLKRRARSCDSGDTSACGALGTTFALLLGEPHLGVELWLRACDAGETDRCADAADVFARPWVSLYDPARAEALYLRSCTVHSRRPHACRLLAEGREISADERFLLLDRACELADQSACDELEQEFQLKPPLPYLASRESRLAWREEAARRGVSATPGGADSDSRALARREVYDDLRTARGRRESQAVLNAVFAQRGGVLIGEPCEPARAGERILSVCKLRVPRGPLLKHPYDAARLDTSASVCVTRCGGVHDARCSCGCLARAEDEDVRRVGDSCLDALGPSGPRR